MRQDKLHSVFRPELDRFPGVALPFYPRSAGHFIRTRGSREFYPPRPFLQLFWGVSGEAEFEIDGRASVLGRDDVLYRLPEDPHIIRIRSEVCEYRWIAFDGLGAKEFLLAFGYPSTCFHAGPCPHELFLEYENRMLERSPGAWRQMVALIVRIVAAAGAEGAQEPDDRLLQKAMKICREGFDRAEFNVNSLADGLGMDRSSLLRLFRRKLSLSPLEYLSQLRLQSALSLLADTRLPLKEVAGRAGFGDVNYFCRFVKQKTGKRPSELR